jgi:hypothetical protein
LRQIEGYGQEMIVLIWTPVFLTTLHPNSVLQHKIPSLSRQKAATMWDCLAITLPSLQTNY